MIRLCICREGTFYSIQRIYEEIKKNGKITADMMARLIRITERMQDYYQFFFESG